MRLLAGDGGSLGAPGVLLTIHHHVTARLHDPWWPESARRSSPIRSPACTTALACSLPGDRVSRSIGPDTEIAASTLPPVPRTGAGTEDTPSSRSAALA